MEVRARLLRGSLDNNGSGVPIVRAVNIAVIYGGTSAWEIGSSAAMAVAFVDSDVVVRTDSCEELSRDIKMYFKIAPKLQFSTNAEYSVDKYVNFR